MGGMMSGSNSNNNSMMPTRQRRLWEDDNTLPVIMNDDMGNNHQMHNMDHNNMHHDMNHDMSHQDHNNNMSNMDDNTNNHSSHSMSMMSEGTIMYMDGFHSALFHSTPQNPPPCLNFLHPSWTLHTPSKFVFAMVCVTLMGMFVEAVGVWRVKCLRKGRQHRREEWTKRIQQQQEEQQQQQQQQQQQHTLLGEQLEYRRPSRGGIQHAASDISNVSSTEPSPIESSTRRQMLCPAFIRRIWMKIVPQFIRNVCSRTFSIASSPCRGKSERTTSKWIKRYDFAAAFLHALRAWLGYLLMLAVMSYAVEFLVCTVLGMTLGRYWFVDVEGASNSGGVGGGGSGVLDGDVGVGGGIGGMGLGGGGRRSVASVNDRARDGTWGGGDPCCGIDDDDDEEEEEDDEDDNYATTTTGGLMQERSRSSIREPLLGIGNPQVTRRSVGGGGMPPEDP
jgi:hypothetical protein